MTIRAFHLVLPLLLVACGSDDKADDSASSAEAEAEDLLQGVWLLQVPWTDPADGACTEGLNHNFPGAYEADDGPWSETDSADRSDAMYFVQIERLGDEEALMLLGREILPGTGDGDSWTFSWEETDDTLELEEHEDGYSFREERSFSNSITLSLTFDDSTASGTWDGATTETLSWEESDEWVDTVGRSSGVIPVGDYLVYDDGDVEGIPESNRRTESDCEEARCSLTWQQSCSGSESVSLRRTSYEDEDVYDLLEEVVQPFGSGAE